MALGLVMPVARQQFFDANGDPLAGGKLYAYLAGTTTPTDLYSDAAVTTPHAWPLILDAGGVAAGIYLSQSVSYKLVLKDDNDVTIWTQDNVSLAPVSDLEAVQDGGLTISGQAANDILVASSSTQIGVLHAVANSALVTDSGGAPTYQSRSLSPLLSANTVDVGNVGSGEDTLMSYSLPTSTLGTDGWAVEILAAFTTAANSNTKQIDLYFGATKVAQLPALTYNNLDVVIRATVIRTGATSQAAIGNVNIAATNGAIARYSEPAETLSGAITIKATGQATADNDIVQKLMLVRLVGVPA